LKASFNLLKKPFFLRTGSAGGFWPVTGVDDEEMAFSRRGGTTSCDVCVRASIDGAPAEVLEEGVSHPDTVV